MALICNIWKVARAVALMLFLGGIYAAVLLFSCLARLWDGNQACEPAGKLRPGS